MRAGGEDDRTTDLRASEAPVTREAFASSWPPVFWFARSTGASRGSSDDPRRSASDERHAAGEDGAPGHDDRPSLGHDGHVGADRGQHPPSGASLSAHAERSEAVPTADRSPIARANVRPARAKTALRCRICHLSWKSRASESMKAEADGDDDAGAEILVSTEHLAPFPGLGRETRIKSQCTWNVAPRGGAGKRGLMRSDLDYVVPSTVEEAVALQAGSSGAVYLLGGTDLLPQMRAGRKDPGRLIDLKRIPLLREVRETEGGGLSIGAAAVMADVEIHPVVLARYPLLAECVKTVGAWPLRQRATLAGNVCNASPAADTAVALLALDATLNLVSAQGRRSIPVSAFFRGPGQTALRPGELMTDVILPAASAGFTGSYLRLSRRKGMDLATVGVLVGKRNGKLTLAARWRIALAAVAPTPLRVPDAEQVLEAKGSIAVWEAAELAVAACRPITDLRGSAEYRRDMVGVLVRRGVVGLG